MAVAVTGRWKFESVISKKMNKKRQASSFGTLPQGGQLMTDYIYTDVWVMATSGERQRYRKTEQFKKFIDDEYAKFINNKG